MTESTATDPVFTASPAPPPGESLARDPRRLPFAAIADDEIVALFAPLARAPGLVLAVSGGPDSLALLLLAARWRALHGAGAASEAASETASGTALAAPAPVLRVVSVDHGLRPAAGGEAQAVAGLAAMLGMAAEVRRWEGAKPPRGVQEAARAARYRLLLAAAREAGASHIVTAHHLDDQAETVLMRLAGGSGVGGLAAMRPVAALPGTPVLLARPLLAVPKARLVAVAAEAGVRAVDDPSNRDPRFARARLRGLAAERAALGLSDARLAKLAGRCARVEDALSAVAAQRFAALADAADGRVTLAAALWREPEEIVLRLLALAVAAVTGAGRPPVSLERLERLGQELQAAPAAGAVLWRTLSGASVRLAGAGTVAAGTVAAGNVAAGAVVVEREPPRRRGSGSRGPVRPPRETPRETGR